MSIRQLPEDVVCKLKSSTVVVSLNGAVTGLLSNALDAGATKVNMAVDYARGNCTVEDNGCGIPPSEFKENGGLGKLHHTSRYPPDDDLHGRHGNFLASLGTFSLLCISSRSQSHIPHSSILVHNAAVLSRHVPAPPEQRLRTFDHGARVMVRDLFGSMPVRVKQRPDASTDRASIEKDWSQLIHDCLALLLSWPLPASVLLREATGDREVRLRSAENADALARVSSLLVQASLANLDHVKSLVPVSASTCHVQITGCMSTKPVASNRAQFISIGVQPIANDRGTNLLYEEVNRVFLNSSFSAAEDDSGGRKASAPSGREKGSRKRVERWPMFHLQIRLRDMSNSHDLDDLLDDRGKHLSVVLDLLKALCYGFLKSHHLGPKKVIMSRSSARGVSTAPPAMASLKKPTSEARSSPQSRFRTPLELRPPGQLSPFDGWQRTKVGHGTTKAVEDKPTPSVINSNDMSQRTEQRLVGEHGRLQRRTFESNENYPSEEALQESSHFKGSGTRSSPLMVEAPQQSRTKPKPRLLQQHNSWDNTVFENCPPPIPRLYDEHRLPLDEISTGVRSKFFDSSAKDCGVMFESGSISLTGRIAKSALSKAEVIAQVDRKFILVKMPLNDSAKEATDALVMLDQHAVDERCKLEDLMLDYFDPDDAGGIRAKVEVVDKHLMFEFADRELELLEQHRDYLTAWGITYNIQRSRKRDQRGDCVATGHIRVIGLPPNIAERCSTEPRLLAELLRREVWDLSDSGRLAGVPFFSFVERATWVSNFHRCPRGILDLLHSRSCRSAVMFNDVLSNEDCKVLLERLARCSFPFQCAHGRPSMAPLVDLGIGSRIGSWHEEGHVSAWKRWMDE